MIRCPIDGCPTPLQARPADPDPATVSWFPGRDLDSRTRAGVAAHLETVHDWNAPRAADLARGLDLDARTLPDPRTGDPNA